MSTEVPEILLSHYLKTLKLPTFLREYQKLARQCATEGVDHVGGPLEALAWIAREGVRDDRGQFRRELRPQLAHRSDVSFEDLVRGIHVGALVAEQARRGERLPELGEIVVEALDAWIVPNTKCPVSAA